MTKATESIGTLRRLIARRLAESFAADGRDGTPDLDARLLVAHVMGCDPNQLVLRDDEPVASGQRRAAMALVDARIAGAPVARLLGEKPFWSLSLRLSDETLVPRPDTETLVGAALAAIDADDRRSEALRILDLGTGTGAILLALLSELPASTGVGIDVSEGAIRTARGNASRVGFASRASFAVGNWASALHGGFDLVVSNPPYITSHEMTELPVEVREHDPHIALDGGADGLSAYRTLFPSLSALLKTGGYAFFEVGRGQAAAIAGFGRAQGLAATTHCDLAGVERVVELRRGKKIGLGNRARSG